MNKSKFISLFILLISSFLLIGCMSSLNPTTTINNNENSSSTIPSTIETTTLETLSEIDNSNIIIECSEGTTNAYEIVDNTITFSTIEENSVYSISGEFNGNIVIDVSDDFEFELELTSFTLVSYTECPINIISADKVTLVAKKNTTNYIYDMRDLVTDDEVINSAIYSLVDLDIQGKGELTVNSLNNKGIHTKDDLKVKNLTLSVICTDNALKGNDSVTVESGVLTLIATQGDGIKTSNSSISSKGKQKGTITISGGTINIYARLDGIDAAYDVVITNDNNLNLNIYTDKYSPYSDETFVVQEESYYISLFSNNFDASIKYLNNDDEYVWRNAEYIKSETVNSRTGRTTLYYYQVEKVSTYSSMQVFIYNKGTELNQEENYYVKTQVMSLNDSYDMISFTENQNIIRYSWSIYGTNQNMGFPMNEGNTEKNDYSAKGIKADNEITIEGGNIIIYSYDDGIHANNDNELENEETPLGNITLNGGIIEIHSNDDGIHGDGVVTLNGGIVKVEESYEGIEGNIVIINDGDISVNSKDDGLNAKSENEEAIIINGGYLYIYALGDGIDSNSYLQYDGILFNGGVVIVTSNSNANSAIDSERGYKYQDGVVLAISLRGGMSSESTNTNNFSSIGKSSQMNLVKDNYLNVSLNNETIITMKLKASMNANVVYLGSNSVTFNTSSSSSALLDSNGVYIK